MHQQAAALSISYFLSFQSKNVKGKEQKNYKKAREKKNGEASKPEN